jgi:hypothetical protein
MALKLFNDSCSGLVLYIPFVYFGLRIPGFERLYRKTEKAFNLTTGEKEL